MPKVRKIPQRMCMGCREMKPKKDLIRVVRTPETSIVIDTTGKRSGRGAYICHDPDCLEKALTGRRIEKALKQPISQEIKQALLERMKTP